MFGTLFNTAICAPAESTVRKRTRWWGLVVHSVLTGQGFSPTVEQPPYLRAVEAQLHKPHEHRASKLFAASNPPQNLK